ncbi:hypothetical protein ACH3XW_6165 [Acanthocheilonema viteae]
MAAVTTSLYRTLGKLACDISELSSADVEIIVNVQFKKSTTGSTNISDYPTTYESEDFESAHKKFHQRCRSTENCKNISKIQVMYN